MPRGSGKSTIALGAIIWMLIYGHRKFPIIVAATAKAAADAVGEVMTIMEDSALIVADFPEVMVPILALKGANQKSNGQLYKGKRTRVRWNEKNISLPIIEGSPASASGLSSVGLNVAVRGKKKNGPDGGILRPDFCLIDDQVMTVALVFRTKTMFESS